MHEDKCAYAGNIQELNFIHKSEMMNGHTFSKFRRLNFSQAFTAKIFEERFLQHQVITVREILFPEEGFGFTAKKKFFF